MRLLSGPQIYRDRLRARDCTHIHILYFNECKKKVFFCARARVTR